MVTKSSLIQLIGILILFNTTISSSMEDKFEWSGTVSSPQEYPIEIYDGNIKSEDIIFNFTSIWGTTNNGWGNNGKYMSGGVYAVPDHLEFTWLSIVEKKFYSGKWALPKDKLLQLFKAGYSYKGQHHTYDTFIIGLAPKGMVVVWLMGFKQVEIARYQAEEIVINPKVANETDLYMFRKDFFESTLNDPMVMKPQIKDKIKRIGYPSPKVYEEFRAKYSWAPKIVLPQNCTITALDFKMCNGEKEFVAPSELSGVKQRAIPYDFEIVWKDKNNEEYVCRIAFTGQQTYWSDYLENGDSYLPLDFEKNQIRGIFSTIDKDLPTTIVIKIDPSKKNGKEWVTELYVEQSAKKYPVREINQDSGKY